MKKLTLLIIVIFLSSTCFCQRKIKKLEVKEVGFESSVEFIPIVNNSILDNGLSIEITPVSGERLNTLFNSNNQIDGKSHYSYYDKSLSSFFLKKVNKKTQKSDFDYLSEGLNYLLESDMITQDIYDKLYNLILLEFSSTSSVVSANVDQSTLSNPYYLGNKYMNVFEFELINSSNLPIIFDDCPIIKYGNSLLQPLTNEFLKSQIVMINQNANDKCLTLERFNLSLPIIIPPNSTIIKYFSVLPIDFSSENLNIFFSKNNKTLSWSINRKYNSINNVYTFYELKLSYLYGMNQISGTQYSILLSDKPSFTYFDQNKIFVDSESLNNVFRIFSLIVSDDNLYFCNGNPISASQYIDLTKNKSTTITLPVKYLDQVNK